MMTGKIVSVECYQCSSCGHATLAAKLNCPQCGGDTVTKVSAPGKGKVLDFTTVYFPPENYKDRAPYTSVFVELDNGCKIFGIIEGETKDIEQGSPIRVANLNEQTQSYEFDFA